MKLMKFVELINILNKILFFKDKNDIIIQEHM